MAPADFHVELIGLYTDLIEDGELDDDEEIEGWKAIGRVVAFAARYKSDTEWQSGWETVRREADEAERSGYFGHLQLCMKRFAEPVVA
jgi:hypothetical protein